MTWETLLRGPMKTVEEKVLKGNGRPEVGGIRKNTKSFVWGGWGSRRGVRVEKGDEGKGLGNAQDKEHRPFEPGPKNVSTDEKEV